MNRIEKFELVEIFINAGNPSSRFSFPDLPKLRYTALLAMEIYVDVVMPFAPSGTDNINSATASLGFLTLYSDERQDIYRVPLLSLNRVNDLQSPFVYHISMFKGQKITWDKSYVEFTQALNPVTNKSINFGVYYA